MAEFHDLDWTLPTMRYLLDLRLQHAAELRECDLRFHEERDRRYAEVNLAQEKALAIKDQADRDALELAREFQKERDAKANELREQIGSERGLYVTKDELTAATREFNALVKPLADYVTSQQGRQQGIGMSAGVLTGGLAALATVMTIVVVVVNLLTSG
jgi:hypothetical protein